MYTGMFFQKKAQPKKVEPPAQKMQELSVEEKRTKEVRALIDRRFRKEITADEYRKLSEAYGL